MSQCQGIRTNTKIKIGFRQQIYSFLQKSAIRVYMELIKTLGLKNNSNSARPRSYMLVRTALLYEGNSAREFFS